MPIQFLRSSTARLCGVLMLATSAGVDAQTSTFSYRGDSQEIGPLLNNVAELQVYVEGLGNLTDLDVRLDALPGCSATAGNTAAAIAHTRIGELVVTLVSPNNTELVLIDNRGGLRSNFCQTLLDDDGGHPTLGTLTSVAGQFAAGSFRPDNPLSTFDGEPPNGFWTLRIQDETVGPSNVGRGYRYSLLMQSAPVPEIVVDRLDDPAPDACTPGDCSLREAVAMANARPGLDRIRLPAGTLQLTRAGAGEMLNMTGDLNVLEGAEIVGAGAASTTLVQTVADRVVSNAQGRDLTLRALRIEGGRGVIRGGAVYALGGKLLLEDATFAGNASVESGGAVHHLGGGLNDGSRPQVIVRRVLFDGNQTGSGGAVMPTLGGALYAKAASNGNSYAVQVEETEFRGNRAAEGGGAIAFDNEGGLQPFSRFQVTDSLFFENRVTGEGDGGAIGVNFGGGGSTDTLIERSIFQRNSVSSLGGVNRGGALWVSDGSVGTTRTIVRDSTFCGNIAQVAGGAIHLQDAAGVVGSTFCDNLVRSVDTADLGGGAIALDYGQLEVALSTFEGNRALRGGAITVDSGNFVLRSSTLAPPATPPAGAMGTALRINHLATDAASLVVANNILLGNCSFFDVNMVFDTARNNIEDANTCRLTRASVTSDNQVNVTTTAIGLQPLGDNGGPTDTRMPAAGSIAIDSGYDALCPQVDQRGYLRGDDRCDVGAVEVSAVPASDSVFANGFEGQSP